MKDKKEAKEFLLKKSLVTVRCFSSTKYNNGDALVLPWNMSPLNGSVTTVVLDQESGEVYASSWRLYHNGSHENGSPEPNHEVFQYFRDAATAAEICRWFVVQIYNAQSNSQEFAVRDSLVEGILLDHPDWTKIKNSPGEATLRKSKESSGWTATYTPPSKKTS